MACSTSSFLSASEMRSLAVDKKVVWIEICEIQKRILEETNNCSSPASTRNYRTIVKDTTPMTYVSGLTSAVITNPGSGYFPTVVTATVTHPIGTGATFQVFVTPAGSISHFVVTNQGTGYTPIFASTDLTGLGSGTAFVTLSITDGIIVSANIVNQGTGYVVGQVIPVIHPNGTGAVLQVGSIGGSGQLTSVTIVDGGTGYEAIYPEIILSHPYGTGFSGSVEVNGFGQITQVIVNEPGFGYGPVTASVTVIDPDGGVGAVLKLDTNVLTGEIVDVDILEPGHSYGSTVSGNVIAPPGGGSGATITLSAVQNPYNTIPIDYYYSITNQSDNLLVKDQIFMVRQHFTELGYTIRAIVNSKTNKTIAWDISW